MQLGKRFIYKSIKVAIGVAMTLGILGTTATAVDIAEIRKRGVLRHIGVTYAHFVRETPDGIDGLDVELMQLFAKHLGVRYELVKTTWSKAFGDLTGQMQGTIMVPGYLSKFILVVDQTKRGLISNQLPYRLL